MNQWIFTLINLVVTMMSPELRKNLTTWLAELEAQAKKTANPWDDMLVAMLKTILLRQ